MMAENQDSMQRENQIEASELFSKAVTTGARRLDRNMLEVSISGVIAGMNVAFGAIAAAAVAGAIIASFGPGKEPLAHVMGAIVFPIGFIFVVIGRSELFTENFLVPTVAVIAKRARLINLMRLWGLTLIGNLVGAVIVAAMVSIESYHGVPGRETLQHLQHTADFLVNKRDFDASFYSAVFAGWLITLMTWLLISCRGVLAKVAIIWCVGFVIMVNSFNHVVVNTAEVLMAVFTKFPAVTLEGWVMHNFGPTLIGNIIGGLVFVTLLEYLKVMKSS